MRSPTDTPACLQDKEPIVRFGHLFQHSDGDQQAFVECWAVLHPTRMLLYPSATASTPSQELVWQAGPSQVAKLPPTDVCIRSLPLLRAEHQFAVKTSEGVAVLACESGIELVEWVNAIRNAAMHQPMVMLDVDVEMEESSATSTLSRTTEDSEADELIFLRQRLAGLLQQHRRVCLHQGFVYVRRGARWKMLHATLSITDLVHHDEHGIEAERWRICPATPLEARIMPTVLNMNDDQSTRLFGSMVWVGDNGMILGWRSESERAKWMMAFQIVKSAVNVVLHFAP